MLRWCDTINNSCSLFCLRGVLKGSIFVVADIRAGKGLITYSSVDNDELVASRLKLVIDNLGDKSHKTMSFYDISSQLKLGLTRYSIILTNLDRYHKN